jgi:N-formylglutamate amidohydrolase
MGRILPSVKKDISGKCYRRYCSPVKIQYKLDIVPAKDNKEWDCMNYVLKTHGNIPLVLSVPHGGMEEPRDFLIRRSGNRMVDMFTLDLARELAGLLQQAWGVPYLAAGLLRRCIIDYNRPPGESYDDPGAARHYLDFHSALEDCIARALQEHGACLLLDIHGRKGGGLGLPQVVLGTGNFTGMDQSMTRHLCRLIGEMGCMARHDTAGPYRGGYIVRRYAGRPGVYGVQLEISRPVRENSALRADFLSSLTGALCRFAGLYLCGNAVTGGEGTIVKSSPNPTE